MATAPESNKRLDLNEVIRTILRLYGQNFPVFALFAILFLAVPQMLSEYGMSALAARQLTKSGTATGEAFSAYYYLGTFLGFLLGQAIAALFCIIVSRWTLVRMQGRSPRFAELADSAGKTFLVVLGIQLISALGIGLGLALLIVPGLMVASRWAVATVVAIIEGKPPFAALKRSSDLTLSNRGPIVGLLLLYFVLVLVIAVVGDFLGDQIPMTPVNQSLTAPAIVTCIQSLLAVLPTIAAVVLYVELRRIRDGGIEEETARIFD